MKVFSNKIALINNSSATIDELRVLEMVSATPGATPGDTWLAESGAGALDRRSLYQDDALRLKVDGGSDVLAGQRHDRRSAWTFRRPGGGDLRASVQLHDDIGEQWLYLSLSDPVETLSDWMSRLGDDKLLSEIRLPGSNQSASYGVYEAMRQHQYEKMDIAHQLAAGIRYLHLEVDIDGDRFVLRDEGVAVPVAFEDVLSVIKEFLGAHPTETVSVLLKGASPEANEPASAASFTAVFLKYQGQEPDLWYVQNTIPALKDVRGKIILWRAFANDAQLQTWPLGLGIDTWKENSTGFTQDLGDPTDPHSVYIQNVYDIQYPSRIENKFLLARQVLVDSAKLSPNRLYVAYFAAAGLRGQDDVYGSERYTPQDMAEGYTFESMVHGEGEDMPAKALTYRGVNEWLELELDQYINDAQQTPAPHAIFVLDYASVHLCEKIVQLNFLNPPS